MRRLNYIMLFLAAAAVALGQYQEPGAQYPAPPQGAQAVQPSQQEALESDDTGDRDHGVARLSVTQGDVNLKRGDNGQLAAAVVNAPLMAHDHVETAPGSRAEIQLDSVTFVRLGPNTDVGFADLAYHRYQAQLGVGTMVLRLVEGSAAQLEVDTPSVTFRPLGQGEYRISVFDNGTSQVTVRSGRLEMYGPNGSQTVDAGHSLLVRGDATDPEYQSGYEIARDQLDEWSAARDNELQASQSYRYVSQDVGGAQDLDANGSWVPSQYGQVWTPQSVPAGWSPYSNGQWSYEDYYGWTWIDNASWGWAPYHYGRWFVNSGRWCWWPGARGSSFYWSPALVGFFGFGRGLGWVALAPFELGFSWWGHGHGFGYGGFGINSYRNAGFRGGAMTTGFGAFGGPNHRFNAATRADLAGASFYRGQIPVSPGQGAYRFSNRAAAANPRLAAAGNRQFFSQRALTAPRANNGRTAGGGGGWQRFGEPSNHAGVPRQSFAAPRAESSGWHTFGSPQPATPGNRGSGYSPRQSYSPQQHYNTPAQQHYNAPAQQHYNAPAQQHYNAPAPHYSAPQSHGGGGGGGSHGGGSGGGGHHGR